MRCVAALRCRQLWLLKLHFTPHRVLSVTGRLLQQDSFNAARRAALADLQQIKRDPINCQDCSAGRYGAIVTNLV